MEFESGQDLGWQEWAILGSIAAVLIIAIALVIAYTVNMQKKQKQKQRDVERIAGGPNMMLQGQKNSISQFPQASDEAFRSREPSSQGTVYTRMPASPAQPPTPESIYEPIPKERFINEYGQLQLQELPRIETNANVAPIPVPRPGQPGAERFRIPPPLVPPQQPTLQYTQLPAERQQQQYGQLFPEQNEYQNLPAAWKGYVPVPFSPQSQPYDPTKRPIPEPK